MWRWVYLMRSSYDPHSEYITWFVQECKVLKIVTCDHVLFLVSFKIYHLVWSVLQYPPGVQSTKNSNMYCMWSYVLFLVPFRISPRLQASMGVACSFSSCSSFSSYSLVHVLRTSLSYDIRSTALTLLLKDPAPQVRASTAEAMSLLDQY